MKLRFKFFILSILGSLVLIEILMRTFYYQPSFKWFSYDDNLAKWNRGKDDSYFQLFPDQKGFLTFNSNHERSSQNFTEIKKDGVFRVLIMGTSLTIGWPFNHGVAEFLTEDLKRKFQQVEVINCSIGNSNLATLIKSYKANCQKYQNVDLLVLALPVNTLVDTVAANSFLFGENYIDDPNILFYLMKKYKYRDMKIKKSPNSSPKFILSSEQREEIKSYYNKRDVLYDYSQIYRMIYNRLKYLYVFDKNFLEQLRLCFEDNVKNIPSIDLSMKIIKEFQALNKKTKIQVALVPTFQALMLNPSLKDTVIQKINTIPYLKDSLNSPTSFVATKFGNLDNYLGSYNNIMKEFEKTCRENSIKVSNFSEGLSSNDLTKYYLNDLYHLSLEGHRHLANIILQNSGSANAQPKLLPSP